MKIYTLSQIKSVIDISAITRSIEDGFIAFSTGKAQLPPPGHLSFPEVEGECHIKFAHVFGQEFFAVKIATGFFQNSSFGLPSSNGCICVWNSKNGLLEGILLDEGYLTDLRTAMAGRITAQYLAPSNVPIIGVLGTGIQARLQVELLQDILPTRKVHVWGRTKKSVLAYQEVMTRSGYQVTIASSPEEIARSTNFIVTTTASKQPLLDSTMIQPGTHITALGADGGNKNEIAPSVFKKASVVIADSIEQCVRFGDLSYAIKEGYPENSIEELGHYIISVKEGKNRRLNDAISIVDLTGLGVQDAQIASTVMQQLLQESKEVK